MKFLFTCGGTAGHINPALAVADEIKAMLPDAKFLFVGSGREMENRLIRQAGYDLLNITISGFARGIKPKQLAANVKTVKNLLVSNRQTAKILRDFKPDIAIGTGGYVCYPVLKKAAAMHIPTLLHESNAVPGLTAKVLSGTVDKVLVAFPNVSRNYKLPERVQFTGTPVRGGFQRIGREEARRRLGIDDKPLVVSFWGSLGASLMNRIMADFIQLNYQSGAFHHIHATGGGENGVETMSSRLKEFGIADPASRGIDLRPYIDDMWVVMAAADLILCRAGASTLAELTMMGKPAIIVPSPNVTNGHQEKNAMELKKNGAAEVILEKDCTGDVLFHKVTELLSNKTLLTEMSLASARMGVPDAAKKISELILSLA